MLDNSCIDFCFLNDFNIFWMISFKYIIVNKVEVMFLKDNLSEYWNVDCVVWNF